MCRLSALPALMNSTTLKRIRFARDWRPTGHSTPTRRVSGVYQHLPPCQHGHIRCKAKSTATEPTISRSVPPESGTVAPPEAVMRKAGRKTTPPEVDHVTSSDEVAPKPAAAPRFQASSSLAAPGLSTSQ